MNPRETLLPKSLFQPGAVGNFFSKCCQHRSAFVADGGSQQHPLRFVAAHLARFQIRDHRNLPANQLLGRVVLSDACQDLSRLVLAHINARRAVETGRALMGS